MAHQDDHTFTIVTQHVTDPNRFTILEPLPGLRLEFATRQQAQAFVERFMALDDRLSDVMFVIVASTAPSPARLCSPMA